MAEDVDDDALRVGRRLDRLVGRHGARGRVGRLLLGGLPAAAAEAGAGEGDHADQAQADDLSVRERPAQRPREGRRRHAAPPWSEISSPSRVALTRKPVRPSTKA